MVVLLLILFLLISGLSFISFPRSKEKITTFYILGSILIILAAFRGENVDRDYESYIELFNNVNGIATFIEPSFLFISWIINLFFHGNIVYLFLIYAVLGVSLKLLAIKQYSQFWFLSLLIYVSYSFPLHEMTQIRAGVAAALILLSIKPLYERKLYKFLIIVFSATLFHYSSIIVFPIWFLKPDKIKKWLFIIAIPVAYLIHISLKLDFTSLASFISFLPLQKKLLAYKPDNTGYLNVFNVWQLLRIGISYLLVWKADLISEKNKYGYLFIKLYLISTCAYVILASNPSFAGRIGDLFAIADIISLPLIYYTIRQKNFAKIFIILVGFSYLFLNLFYNKIIT